MAGYDPVLREAMIYWAAPVVAAVSVAGVFLLVRAGFGLDARAVGGAWYLVLVGGIAVLATLLVPRGLWGFVTSRWGWSLFPVGYRVPSSNDHRDLR